jgi:hypothetical protein
MLCLSGNTFVGITIFHNIGEISNSFLEKHLFLHIMSITVNEYYHECKDCVLFDGLDECKKDVLSRFMKGLNSEIQTMLIHETLVTCFWLLELLKNRFHYLAILA